MPFVSERCLHFSFHRQRIARNVQLVRFPPWAQEHKLLRWFPSYFPGTLGWKHWGALLSSPSVMGRCVSPTGIRRVNRKECMSWTSSLCLSAFHTPLSWARGFFSFFPPPVFASQGQSPPKPLLNILTVTPLSAVREHPPSLREGGLES